VNEFELIARFFSRSPRASSVHLGVGDDAALLAPSAGCELAVSVESPGDTFFPTSIR
jgi:thiamine-monophosphate kinase